MLNPFVRTSAGIFVATGSRAQEPTIAQRICAALSGKIASDIEKALDPVWWTECVGMIPGQMPANILKASNASIVASQGETVQIANLCISPVFAKATVATLPAAIAGLVATLPNLTTLNSLTISLSMGGALQISLAIITIERAASSQPGLWTESAAFERTETTVNYGDATVASEIDELFGTFEALTNEPYYVCARASS
jgi:flagellar biosynthesis component FlhA